MKKAAIIFTVLTFCVMPAAYAGPVEDMISADRAFAKMADQESVPAAFAEYAARDVRMFPEGEHSYAGRDAMMQRFASWPADATLEWEPVEGMAASSGDFGFTWGTYVFTAQGEDGQTVEHGKYVSIWRKGPDGAWKFIVDIGNASPAPDAAE
jgi:ketosteroid isomerase-like protein